jgi:hypothetical protein
MLLIHARTAWNDYFTGSTTSIKSYEYGTRQTPSGTGVHVLSCLFKYITSGSDGGALCCTSVSYLLVESSSFFSCKTSDDEGGAIRLSNGQCVLHGVCGHDCFSTYPNTYSNGQFARIDVKGDASSKNYVNYSSISRCVIANSNSLCTLLLHNGKICCPSVNISMNKCYLRSGIYSYPYVDSNSVTCSLSYSSFVDNTATGYTCLFLQGSGAKNEIKSCNIIRNTQGSLSTEGTIWTPGYLTIKDSCILENKATYYFYASSCTITLSNCTVDSTSKYGSVVTQNTVTKSFILALNHMSTRNCHSEYDSAGTLTPINQNPSSSKKKKLYYSCERIFHLQCQQEHFIPLASILVFNFVHPYASGDSLY